MATFETPCISNTTSEYRKVFRNQRDYFLSLIAIFFLSRMVQYTIWSLAKGKSKKNGVSLEIPSYLSINLEK